MAETPLIHCRPALTTIHHQPPKTSSKVASSITKFVPYSEEVHLESGEIHGDTKITKNKEMRVIQGSRQDIGAVRDGGADECKDLSEETTSVHQDGQLEVIDTTLAQGTLYCVNFWVINVHKCTIVESDSGCLQGKAYMIMQPFLMF